MYTLPLFSASCDLPPGARNQIIIDRYTQRLARHGAAVYEGCKANLKDTFPIVTGNLGWPCPTGGAIQLQGRTQSGALLNCVVYFFPTNLINSGMDCLIEACRAAVRTVRGRGAHSRLVSVNSPYRIDLTQLAADMYATMTGSSRNTRNSNPAYKFKAIIVIPVFGARRPAPKLGAFKTWLSNFAGLSARHGFFIIEHIHVARRIGLDLNAPPDPGPLTLYFFFAMPSELQCEHYEAPACYICSRQSG